jgi:O-antigen/teichoic acid export membrane protein
MKFVEIISALHASLKMAYGPFLMKTMAQDKEHGKETVSAVTPFYTFAYLAVGLGLSLFIGDFVRLVGQPEYFPVVRWVPIIVGISLINTLYVYYTPGIILSKRTGLLWIPSAINISVLAVAAYPLIGRFGLGGLVATRYISAILFFGINLYISQKVHPFPHRWARLAGMFALACIALALGQWAESLHPAIAAPIKFLILVSFAGAALKGLLRTGAVEGTPFKILKRFQARRSKQ